MFTNYLNIQRICNHDIFAYFNCLVDINPYSLLVLQLKFRINFIMYYIFYHIILIFQFVLYLTDLLSFRYKHKTNT